MPPRRAVELRVGGQTYRVVAGEDDRHVQHLADLVDRKHQDIVPQGRGMSPQQAMFLTALALAEELEEQRSRTAALEAERDRAVRQTARAKEVVGRLLTRVDGALSALSPMPPSVAVAAGDGGKGLSPAPPRADAGGWGDGDGGARRAEEGGDDFVDGVETVHEAVLLNLRPPVKPREAAREVAREAGEAGAAGEEAGVPRTPRGGLRLVRQSSSTDDDPR